MNNSDAARLVLVHATGPDDPYGGAVSDWVASTAWALPGFRLDEVHPSGRGGSGPAWAATTPGWADPVRRLADADAVVVVVSNDPCERLESLEALLELVGDPWRGKPVAMVYAGGGTSQRVVEAVVRLKAKLARASLEADVSFPACASRLEASGCTKIDSPETHALRRMLSRLLTRAGHPGGKAAAPPCLEVA